MSDLTTKILELWKHVDDLVYILHQESVSEEIIKIEHEKGHYNAVFDMIVKMIKSIVNQSHRISFHRLFVTFYKNIHYFCE